MPNSGTAVTSVILGDDIKQKVFTMTRPGIIPQTARGAELGGYMNSIASELKDKTGFPGFVGHCRFEVSSFTKSNKMTVKAWCCQSEATIMQSVSLWSMAQREDIRVRLCVLKQLATVTLLEWDGKGVTPHIQFDDPPSVEAVKKKVSAVGSAASNVSASQSSVDTKSPSAASAAGGGGSGAGTAAATSSVDPNVKALAARLAQFMVNPENAAVIKQITAASGSGTATSAAAAASTATAAVAAPNSDLPAPEDYNPMAMRAQYFSQLPPDQKILFQSLSEEQLQRFDVQLRKKYDELSGSIEQAVFDDTKYDPIVVRQRYIDTLPEPYKTSVKALTGEKLKVLDARLKAQFDNFQANPPPKPNDPNDTTIILAVEPAIALSQPNILNRITELTVDANHALGLPDYPKRFCEFKRGAIPPNASLIRQLREGNAVLTCAYRAPPGTSDAALIGGPSYRMVAYGVMNHEKMTTHADYFNIMGLYVHPTFQRMKIGTEIIKGFPRLLSKIDNPIVSIRVPAHKKTARVVTWLSKHGYELIETKKLGPNDLLKTHVLQRRPTEAELDAVALFKNETQAALSASAASNEAAEASAAITEAAAAIAASTAAAAAEPPIESKPGNKSSSGQSKP